MSKKKLSKTLATLLIPAFAILSAEAVLAETTITVATDSDTAPFTYKEGDKFKGYDVEVVKAIFKGSKDYKVKYETVAFSSILTGIDAGRYQIGANAFNYNEERAQKYQFSLPISRSNYAIASQSAQKLSSLDDLSGQSTEVLAGSNYAQILENWNKKNSDKKPITINYVADSSTITTRLQNVESGKTDFVLYDAISLDYIIKDQGLQLKTSKFSQSLGDEKDGLEYLVFSKDEDKNLVKFVNKRIKTLKKDGTLVKLSKKYFGGDFVSSLK